MLQTVVLDSKNATLSNGRYSFTLPDKYMNLAQFRFNRIIFPRNFYNVKVADVTSAFGNNTFSVTMFGGGTSTITIPSGVYTLASLCSAIQTQLILVDANFTCVSSPLTYMITIANGVTNFTITLGTKVATLLGMSSTTVMAASVTGTNVPNMVMTSYFTIHCDLLARHCYKNMHTDSRGDMLELVPLNGTFGDVNVYEKNMEKWYKLRVQGEIISQIVVYFLDEWGYKINLMGGNWAIELDFGGYNPYE